MLDAESTHAEFLQRLDKSQSAVCLVAGHLTKQGVSVTIGGLQRSPTRAGHEDFSDSGDMSIHLRVEVKQITTAFTGENDWPFPDFIVCGKESFDRAERQGKIPNRYYILNPRATHFGMVHVPSTRESWSAVNRMDGRRREQSMFYVMPPSKVFWGELNA